MYKYKSQEDLYKTNPSVIIDNMVNYMDCLRKGVREKASILQMPLKLKNIFKNIVKVCKNIIYE